MNFETLKSIILFILIMLSLFLTVALWNYQPNHDPVEDPIAGNTDISGQQLTTTGVVKPNDIIFHNQTGDYGFNSINGEKIFYQQVQDWTLYNIEDTSKSGFPEGQIMSEIVFPTDLPINTLMNIFKVSEEDQGQINSMLSGSFKHIFFMLDESTESITEVLFISGDGENVIRAQIQAQDAFADLIKQHRSLENKQELIRYENKNTRIFIPKNEVAIADHYISVTPIDSVPLLNALFSDISRVKRSTNSENQIRFSDYDSEMRIHEDENSMVLEKAILGKGTKSDELEVYELIPESMSMINNHKGWTDDYQLFEITETDHQVSYRMNFQGVPILEPSRLSEITVTYLQGELYMYKRPLINIKKVHAQEEDEKDIVLDSGEKILEALENNPSINQKMIQDISVGYRLVPSNPGKENYFYTLMPAWYVKYKGDGDWTKVDTILEDFPLPKGADRDAMGSN